MTPITRFFCRTGAAALLAILGAATSNAQPAGGQSPAGVDFPAGLDWQVMDFASLGYRPEQYGTPAIRKRASSIWQKTIDSFPKNTISSSGGVYPAFVLLGEYSDSRYRYSFSILSAAHTAYPLCEDPPNMGNEATPIYSMCPLRVVIESEASGKQTSQDFPGYCAMLGFDEENRPQSENHTEIAFDQQARTAYFRVFQYGKLVPSCNRAVKL